MPTPTRIGSYSPATARRIYEAIETLEQSGILTRARDRKQPLRSRDPAFPPLKFRNDSGEEIPAYGCMEITGTVEIADVMYFKAVKPSSGVATKPVMFNLHNAVADGDYGLADAGVEIRALCDDTAAATGTRFAPASASWQMTEDAGGAFMFLGPDEIDANAGRFVLVGDGSQTALAKNGASTIAARSTTTMGSGTVTLQDVDGTTISASSITVTAYNWSQSAVAANAYIVVGRERNGQWLVLSEDCA